MKAPILLFSAADRYNLGDILYPIVYHKLFLRYCPDQTFSNFALKKTDLSKIGALRTFGYKTLKKQLRKKNKKIIFIAGGDCLSCSRNELFSHSSFGDHCFSKITSNHPYILRAIQKLYWIVRDKIRTYVPPYPFHFQKNNSTLVIYNSVSGSKHFSIEQKEAFESNVDYCKVRTSSDNVFFSSSQNFGIVPDTITLLSEFYPNPQSHQNFNIPPKFIFFQISNRAFIQHKKNIINALNQIYSQEHIPFILCPIGLAYEHDDFIALKSLSIETSAETILVNKPHIFDTICLLSHATLYIGTSLHGSIISMSYERPYIAMRFIDKVASYMDTWSINELKGCCNYEDLPKQVHSILHNNKLASKLAQQKKELSSIVHSTFQEISNLIQKFEHS